MENDGHRLHFRLEPLPGYKLVASCEAGGAAPSALNLGFKVFPRPGGPLWADGAMKSLPVDEDLDSIRT